MILHSQPSPRFVLTSVNLCLRYLCLRYLCLRYPCPKTFRANQDQPSTTVERALQIAPFMQNKPNLSNPKITATCYNAKPYTNIPLRHARKNKPKQTQASDYPNYHCYPNSAHIFRTWKHDIRHTKQNPTTEGSPEHSRRIKPNPGCAG